MIFYNIITTEYIISYYEFYIIFNINLTKQNKLINFLLRIELQHIFFN